MMFRRRNPTRRVGWCLAAMMGCLTLAHLSFADSWVEFEEQSNTRMIADADVGLLDDAEKDFAVGDVDNDGDDDLVVVRKVDNGSFAGPLRNVLFMNEDGILVDRTVERIPAFLDLTTDRDVILTDVDGDGWLDIVTAPAYDGTARIYMNQGETDGEWLGYVYEPSRLPNWFEPPFCAVAAGDIDNQNGPDLYFVTYNSDEFEDKLMINDGNGFFTDETESRLPTGSGPNNPDFWVSDFGTAVEIVDMNGDGELDIIKSEDGPVRIAYNNGTGHFDIMQQPYNLSAYFMKTFDLDNDGDLDFHVADDGVDRYVINQGTFPNGTVDFVSFTADSSTDGFGSNTTIADLNNDGFVDVIVADVDVDEGDCNGDQHLLRNTGISGSGNLTESLPLGAATQHGVHDQAIIDLNLDGWPDMIVGTCDGYTIFINIPPSGIVFSYPQGLPTFVLPFEDYVLQVKLQEVGATPIEPGSAMFFLSINDAPFESLALEPLGDDTYEVTLPGEACLTPYRFYVTAELTTGEEFSDPSGAPTTSHAIVSALGTEIILRDEIEGDVSGWTIISEDLLTGEWEQADPNGTIDGGGFANPEDDATNGDGVMAFITENGPPGGSDTANDVDGGPTFLITPTIDLAGTDATISYARWMYNDDVGTEDEDVLTVDISNDDGQTWVSLGPHHTTSSTNHAWQTTSFVVGDFIEPTATIKVRFVVADQPNSSVTEAGIDNFQVEIFVCGETIPCEGDANGDGMVDPLDSGYLLARFGCPVGTGDPDCDSADQNSDGAVDPLDSGFVLARFGSCP